MIRYVPFGQHAIQLIVLFSRLLYSMLYAALFYHHCSAHWTHCVKIVVYAVVIFGVWHIPGARVVINPLKLFTIGWHELCHIIAVRSHLIFSCGLHHGAHCISGNIDRGHNIKNNHWPNHGWCNHSRRRHTIHHPLLRVHRVKSVWRTIYPWRLGYLGR